MQTRTKVRKRPPAAASHPLAALFEFCRPGRPYRVASGVIIRKAPPGSELLCLEPACMNNLG